MPACSIRLMADPTGFKPVIFPVTGGRVNQATLRVHEYRGWESDPQPLAYDAIAPPLSYPGITSLILEIKPIILG